MATDKQLLNKRIFARNFAENNGSVLRTVNILKTKYNKLKNLQFALNMEQNEIENSVNYLFEAGYLHLRNAETKAQTSLADADFDSVEGKLTAKGIRLLAGAITDECVDI
ncbi:MAG: type VI secretion protein [Ruminococcus sp.]|nr:type VI secretion protein [Ruminococcus sp.]MDE6671460.1 type VI secretion protein [Ruminococcus sp.]MDE6796671.1 type VI secretion protein [Ruminococcus sp.]